MVKVVLDTNVWISAIFFKGRLRKILDAWKNQQFELAVSPQTLLELERKLLEWGQKMDLQSEVLEYLNLLKKKALHIYSQKQFALCDDPTDNKFLDAAYASEADYLVSGDKKVQKIKKLGNTKKFPLQSFFELS